MTANAPPAASRRPVWRNAWLLVALVAVGLAGWQWVDHRARMAELRREIGQRLDLRQEQENAAGKQVRNDLAAAADRLTAVEARLAAGDEQGRALQALYQDISHGRDELAPVEATCDRPDGEGWNAELAALYGRIARAEDWLRQHPRDPGLLLTLGRLCLQQRLWGKAQSDLEVSLAVGRTRAAHLELAQLFTQLRRDDEAHRHYRAGAAMTDFEPEETGPC